MIKLSAFLVLFFFSFYAESQTYKPMLAQFNEWHLTSCFGGCGTDVYYTDADTIVNGYTYSVLDGFHYISRGFLLRENVANKKVYLLLTGVGKTDTEYLLYDFSLMPGDSMLIYNPISPLPDSAGYFVVDSIAPDILIDGDTYRHFYLTASDSVQSQSAKTEWIEGIGSLSLINAPGGGPEINSYGALSCFFNDLTLHYSNLDSIDGCVQVNTDLAVNEIKKYGKISIFPNPASSEVFLSSQTENVESVLIYNVQGKVVISQVLDSSQSKIKINTESLSAGCYIVKMYSDDENQFSVKLIIE